MPPSLSAYCCAGNQPAAGLRLVVAKAPPRTRAPCLRLLLKVLLAQEQMRLLEGDVWVQPLSAELPKFAVSIVNVSLKLSLSSLSVSDFTRLSVA